MRSKFQPSPLLEWGTPLIGLVGTAVGILTSFSRIDTHPPWETFLVSMLASLITVGIGLLLLVVANRILR